MKLTNNELQKYLYGAYYFTEVDGYLHAHQYSKEQEEYFKSGFDFWYERCDASSAKTIEFKSTATEISGLLMDLN